MEQENKRTGGRGQTPRSRSAWRKKKWICGSRSTEISSTSCYKRWKVWGLRAIFGIQWAWDLRILKNGVFKITGSHFLPKIPFSFSRNVVALSCLADSAPH